MERFRYRRCGGTRGFGRLLAMALALVVGALLVLAGPARAGRYTVVQCGFGAVAEAGWIARDGGVAVKSLCDPRVPHTGSVAEVSDRTSGPAAAREGRKRGEGEGGRGTTRLLAWFGRGHHNSEQSVAYGDGATLRGRLIDACRKGLGGERLRVSIRPAPGARAWMSGAMVTTGEDGRFALHLEAGTSRLLRVSLAGRSGSEAVRSQPLHLRVRGGVTFAAEPLRLRTGEVVRLSGRVRHAGARLPRRGKLVAISYYERATGRWRPVIVVRSGADGAFSARYRFRYISGLASIRLRAVALTESGWPYARGASRPLTLEVRG